MTRAIVAETRAFESWQDIQEALVRAIAPLTEEQLGRRLVAGLRSPGEIAEHIVFGRALWLGRALGEGAAEVESFVQWGDGDGRRSAAEVVIGLELTWRLIAARLTGGSAGDEVADEEVEILRTIWGLLDHDLPHAGELSLLLGAYGLPGVEL